MAQKVPKAMSLWINSSRLNSDTTDFSFEFSDSSSFSRHACCTYSSLYCLRQR